MKRALFPGSFDPFTNGHLDIVKRASELFDEVVIGVGMNTSKKSLFSDVEKIDLINNATMDMPNVSATLIHGLTANFAVSIDAGYLVRGIRNEQDFLYERSISEMNNQLTGIETVFLMATPNNQMLSSSLIKEVAMAKGDVSAFLPENVYIKLEKKLG